MKLFKYIQVFRKEVSEEFNQTNSRIERLIETLDSFAKGLDDDEIEQTAK